MRYLLILLTLTAVVSSCKKDKTDCEECSSADVVTKTAACRVIVNDIFNTRLTYWADSGSCADCFTDQFNQCKTIAQTMPQPGNEICDSLYSRFKFDIIAAAASGIDVTGVDSAEAVIARDKAIEKLDDILECAK